MVSVPDAPKGHAANARRAALESRPVPGEGGFVASTESSPGQTRSFPPWFVPPNEDDLSSHSQRQAIGYVGFFLPVLLWLVSGWRSTHGSPGWKPLDSISEYYYSGAVAIFAGALAALAVFLFTYQGYRNDRQRLDQLAGKIASLAALGVAFFPTAAIAPFAEPSWWAEWMNKVHYLLAATLFLSFIVYSLFLFPRTDPKKGLPTPSKKRRNLIYRTCGLGMVACMVWAVIAGSIGVRIFWPESLALWAFAFSWLVKGKADWTLGQAGRRAFYYGGHALRTLRFIRRPDRK